MPTVDEYAASVVQKYRIEPDLGSAAHRAADEVVPHVKNWGKQYLAGLTLSGAYAKNTAVSVSTHVDLLVALKPVPNMEMKNIFWNLFEYMTEKGMKAHTRDVTVQLEHKGLRIDLIPSYRERSGDLLFNKRSGEAVKTDVGRHVHLVGNSGRQQEICALKIWRERMGLDFPSLYLELTVLHALENERFGQVAENVLAVLRYLAQKFERVVVKDPANAKNIVSADLGEDAKKQIAKTARDALYNEEWKKIIW